MQLGIVVSEATRTVLAHVSVWSSLLNNEAIKQEGKKGKVL